MTKKEILEEIEVICLAGVEYANPDILQSYLFDILELIRDEFIIDPQVK
jgi:hypothetical protein